MHYHLEIVMPPTDDIEAAVKQILTPFNENIGENEEQGGIRFWDWWVIGGRFAGTKFKATLDPEKLKEFHAELEKRQVTVSSFTAGKRELAPASQIPMVDALWNDYFPQTNGGPCPLFNHSNDQYKSDSLLPDDVTRFADVPDALQMERIIFAGADGGKGVEAKFMLSRDVWNGVNHEITSWDGSWADAVARFTKHFETYLDGYRESIAPRVNWPVVTVDYHS